jgi:hypothetical protein
MDWDALLRGDILVESVVSSTGVPGLKALFTVRGNREAIWRVLLDYSHYKSIYEDIKNIKVLEQDATGASVEFWIDAMVMELHYSLLSTYNEPGYSFSWKKIAGDLKQAFGSWRILDSKEEGVYLLIYESYIDIGFSVASRMVRYFATKKAHIVAQRVRARVQGDGSKK